MKMSRLVDRAVLMFLAALFGFAGVDKFVHYDGFTRALADYKFVPNAVAPSLAPLLIAAEIAIAVGLLVPSWRLAAAFQGAFLMTVLTFALALNRALGSEGICGCWFSVTMTNDSMHFLLNLLVIGMSAMVYFGERSTALGSSTDHGTGTYHS